MATQLRGALAPRQRASRRPPGRVDVGVTGTEWIAESGRGEITEPPFAAGQGWDYSDTNYIVLGMIIEKVTGQSYSEHLHATITRAHLAAKAPFRGLSPGLLPYVVK